MKFGWVLLILRQEVNMIEVHCKNPACLQVTEFSPYNHIFYCPICGRQYAKDGIDTIKIAEAYLKADRFYSNRICLWFFGIPVEILLLVLIFGFNAPIQSRAFKTVLVIFAVWLIPIIPLNFLLKSLAVRRFPDAKDYF